MALMTITSQSQLEAARIGFHAAFLEQLGMTEKRPLEDLFLQVQSSTGLEEWQWLGDLPDMEEWKGDRFLQGLSPYKMRVANKDWASGIRVHQNEIKDDKLGLVQPKIQQLAQKARGHRSRLSAKLLINGAAGTAYPDVGNGLGYDGALYFSTAHATGSNKMTAAFSSAELVNAELLLQMQTSYDGLEPLDIMGTHLIVGPKLLAAAQKLMVSDYLPTAAGTANESNFLKGRYTIILEPLLRGTYDDYWYLADLSKPIKPLLFQMREDVTSSAILGNQNGAGDSIPRFQRGELWFGAEARYNVAYLEHRLIVGSIVA